MKLTVAQLQSLIGESYLDNRGKNLLGKCPYCGGNEWGISLGEDHLFNCYRKKACGKTGNIYTLLKHLGRAKEFISKNDIDVFGKLQSTLGAEKPLDLDLPEIKPPLLWKRIMDDPYLRDRGFTDDQFKKFEVGRSRFKNGYITFLIRRDGRMVGYISRSDKSKEWIDKYNAKQKLEGTKLVFLRYDNSSTDFSKTLFGIDEVIEGQTRDVILVEGIFSKTKTDLNLELDAGPEVKCCATFGAKFSDEQAELLRRKKVKNLYFWFEADVLSKIRPIIAKASASFNVKAGYIVGKDPGDMEKEEAIDLVTKSKNWLDFNTSYIAGNLK